MTNFTHCALITKTYRNDSSNKMRKIFPLIFFLMFCFLFQEKSLSQVPSTKEEQDFTFALGLLKDKNYQLAHEQFTSFIKNYPESFKHTDAEFHAAECLFHEENLTDAANRLGEFLLRYPNHRLAPDAAFYRAEIHFRREEYSKAQAAYRTVLDNFSDHPLASEAAYWAGESSYHLNDYKTALKYYSLSYENYPQNRLRDYALFSVAFMHEKMNELNDAYENYLKLLKEFPSSGIVSDANTHVAAILFMKKEYQKTIDWINGLADSPDGSNASSRLFYRAESEYQLGHYTKAEELYTSFLAAYPNNARTREVQYSRGWSLLQQNKYSEAITIFDQLANGNDVIAEASRFRKGVALRLSKQTAKAEEVFQSLITLNPKGEYTDNALFEMGMIAFEKKDYERASGYFKRELQEFPKSDIKADAYNMYGEIQLVMKNYESALSAFQQVADFQNAPVEIQSNALFREGFTLFQLKKFAEAATKFEAFTQKFSTEPRSTEALLWKAESMFQAGDYASAIQTYSRILDAARDDVVKQDALYGLGWSYYKQKYYPEAEDVFKRLTKDFRAGKHDVDANVRLGDVQYAMQNYVKAAETYRYTARMYAKNPLAPYALLRLALVDHRVGSTAMGINTLKSLMLKYPDSPYCDEAQYNIGWMYFQKKDYSIAISEFEKLVKNYPTSPYLNNAMYSIADAYYNMGRYAEADSSYRQMIEKYPRSSLVPDALNGIADCLRQQGKTDEAQTVAATYLKNNPSSDLADLIIFRHANDLYAQKNFDAAIVEYRKIINQFDSSAVIPQCYLQIARAQYALNKFDDAKKTLTEMNTKCMDQDALVEAELFLCDITEEEQQHGTAVEILSTLLTKESARNRKDEIYFKRAHIYRTMHDEANAQKDFQRTFSINPEGNYGVRSNIQLLLIESQKGKVDSAVQILHSISASRTDDIGAEAQCTAGQILLEAKRYTDAEKELLRVEYVFPNSIEYCAKSILSLGSCFQLQGATAKARQSYRKVIDKYGGTDAATEAANQLNKL